MKDEMKFQRMVEPNESAFSILVPEGWLMEGGIFRPNAATPMPSANAIAAKLHFALKRDPMGNVMIQWLPDILYCDLRMSPAGGLFPPGSTYQGMLSCPLMPSNELLVQIVFPQSHPLAAGAEIIEQRSLPQFVQNYQRRMAPLQIPSWFTYGGGSVTFRYDEAGVRYQEKAYTIIENMGQMTGGMWCNRETVYLRTPLQEFSQWEPVFSHIQDSVQVNPHWIAREMASQRQGSQMFHSAQKASEGRDQRFLRTQRQIQDIDRQIVDHRQRTNAEIANDQYLKLTGQEEYIDPHTGEIEITRDEGMYRWRTDGDEEFFSDDRDDDPNVESVANRSDWRRSPIRPRFPYE